MTCKMASKPEKVKKVKSSATLDRDEELSRKSSMESSGGDNPGLVQRSATRDILDFSEDSYVSGDARGKKANIYICPKRIHASCILALTHTHLFTNLPSPYKHTDFLTDTRK